MATPEALTKYYDCLKDSFNKIQVKDNKTALVNAALRPKIREEFAKSKDVLTSYLNYIQVFTLIYSDKFSNICMNIICPIFKEHKTRRLSNETKPDNTADLVHETLREIVKSKPELAEELVNSIIKCSPAVYDEDRDCFLVYLANSLIVCTYINDEPLTSLIAKIMDRVNPPPTTDITDEDIKAKIRLLIDKSYELLYCYLDDLKKTQLDDVVSAILNCFTGDFLTTDCEEQFKYFLLYTCSKDPNYAKILIDSLWSTFVNTSRPYEERSSSVCFASSFMSRAKYIELGQVFDYLDRSSNWCNEILADISSREDSESSDSVNQTTELLYDVVQSILYLITQRYREMYEQESIDRLKSLKLDEILDCKLRPLDACDSEITQRYCEVATLYKLSNMKHISRTTPARKRRKSGNELKRQLQWRPPFKEISNTVPDKVKQFYYNYYDHRNFTVYRE